MTVFLLASGGVVLTAIADKLADEYGIPYVGTTIKLILPIVAAGAGYWLFDASPVLRFLW